MDKIEILSARGSEPNVQDKHLHPLKIRLSKHTREALCHALNL
jgi:hypothetical protein